MTVNLTPRYQEKAAVRGLEDRIKCFWSVKRTLSADNGHIEVLPDRFAELIFSLGAPCSILVEDRLVPLENPFVVGLLQKPVVFFSEGDVHVIGVRFYPWAAHSIFWSGIDSAVPVMPAAGFHFALEQLGGLVTPETDTAAFDFLQGYFTGIVRSSDAAITALHNADRLLSAGSGTLGMADLARRLFTTGRTLQRMYTRLTGLTPKEMARRIRFEQVRDRIWENPEKALADLALEYGYTDQAHLNHEFRRFAAKTPGEFARQAAAARELLKAYFVAFEQDK